jgi:hypothetical protein
MNVLNCRPANAMHQQDNGRRGIEFSNPPPPHMIPVIDPTERVAILIAGSNLYLALKEEGWRGQEGTLASHRLPL